MAADLHNTPVSGLEVQLCGDAHLLNFGGYGTPERNLVFDVNDFDETIAGPFEWDVKRLAASVVVAARDHALNAKDAERAARRTVRSYRRHLAQLAPLDVLDVWYSRITESDVAAALKHVPAKQKARADRKARAQTSARMLPRLTELSDGARSIRPSPPLVVPLRSQSEGSAALDLLHTYRGSLSEDRRLLLGRYDPVDVARKVVGVGSVGTRCFAALMRGRDEDDPLFLQVKEAPPSALEAFVGRSPFTNQGQRVVVGQRTMQAASDVFLGWGRADGHDFYVRQLRDMKASVDLSRLAPDGFVEYSRLCGRALARAHARSSDPAAISAYLGKSDAFDTSVARFAVEYADQTKEDRAELQRAVDRGIVEAQEGI